MDLLLQLLVIVGGFLLFRLYNLRIAKAKGDAKGKEAPVPPGAWPLIGHLHKLNRRVPLIKTLGAMADMYGPAFTLWLGTRRTLIVSSMDVAKECFTTNDFVLATRPLTAAGKYMGYNYAIFAFAPYGPLWRESRKIATQELLSSRRLEILKHVIVTEVDTQMKELHGLWVKNLQNPIKLEMQNWFEELTFNVMIKMIAGKRYFGMSGVTNGDEGRRFVKASRDLFYLSGILPLSDMIPYVEWIDFQGYKREMKRTAKELDSLIVSWAEEHRLKRLSRETEGDNDFIDVILSSLENRPLSGYDHDTFIKATSLSLILGGTDTTAGTLTWVLSLLLNNPSVMKNAQDELDKHVGKGRNVDESDINNFVYLQAIIKETLRLYPGAPLAVPHLAREDCHIGGFFIPAGTQVVVNLWKLQRDPHVWSDPTEFQPERFLTRHVDVDVRGQHFEFIPFGSGRRSCPGVSLALKVLHLTVARLLHGFEMTTASGNPVDMEEGISLSLTKAYPLEVLFTPRLPKELYE